jgi:COMPASS component SWD3
VFCHEGNTNTSAIQVPIAALSLLSVLLITAACLEMEQIETHYETLGLQVGASLTDVKQAYRKLVKIWHPDCFPNNVQMQKQAEEKIKELNEAYRVLKSYQPDSNSANASSAYSSNAVTYTTKPINAEDLYRQAKKSFEQGRYEEAVETLSMAIRVNRSYVEAYQLRSIALEQLGFEYRASSDRGKVAELKRLKNPQSSNKTYRSSSQTARKHASPSPVTTPTSQNWNCIYTFSEHAEAIATLATYRHGKMLVSGSKDNTIKLWNLQTGKLFCTLLGHSAPVLAVAISSDGQLLASGSADQTIKIWHINTASLIRTIKGHEGEVRSICISADRKILISGSADCTVKFWQLSSGSLLRSITKHQSSINSIALSPSNQRLVIGSEDGTITLWFMNMINSLQTLNCYASCATQSPILSTAIHPNGDRFTIGCADASLQIRDIGSGILIHKLTNHIKAVHSIAFSSDGFAIASGGFDQKINIWDWKQGILCHTIKHPAPITSVIYRCDRDSLIAGGIDGIIKIWQRDQSRNL